MQDAEALEPQPGTAGAGRAYRLGTGTLTLRARGENAGALVRIAERQNPRRAFLFVSTVLGRHIPVAAPAHRAALQRLADRALPLLARGPILVMSYAETATGLGLGVFDALCAALPADRQIAFLPTTRFATPGATPWLTMQEPHSHAADHLVLPPAPGVLPEAPEATLILVDDETTTGQTFRNLAAGLAERGLRPARVILLTLTDWSDGRCADAVAPVFGGAEVVAASLLEGRWRWDPDEGAAIPALPGRIPPGCPPWQPDAAAPLAVPRHGLSRADHASAADLLNRLAAALPKPGRRVLVIGTGEHVWHPFRLAEALCARGHEAALVATTRSPVIKGAVIRHKRVFPDHYGLGLEMYLHNADPRDWDDLVLMTETGIAGVPEALRSALGKGVIVDAWGGLHPMTPAAA